MRYLRDWQSITYLFALPAIVVWLWVQPHFNWVAYIVLLVIVVGVCCISHNHAHLPIWRNKWLNRLTDLWIGTLQGHPVYMFHPAHIKSHHRYNQGENDITGVLRYTESNNFLGYILFPFQVLPALRELKKQYLHSLWCGNRRKFWWVIMLHVPIYLLWLSALLVDPYKSLIYVFIPQVVGLHFLLASNYLQHSHAVANSHFNHSRNFIGAINMVWLNVGYHTAHHEHQELHWTRLPQLHKEISHFIEPRLNEKSLVWYALKTLLLGNFIKKFQSRPIEENC